MADDDLITWAELLKDTTEQLANGQEARWLCQDAAGLDRQEFDAGLSQFVSNRCGVALRQMVTRRLGGEPLQYVMSRWEFRHLDVFLDSRVLIPRQETEQVVQVGIDLARKTAEKLTRKLRIVDLGTGSGVIGLSLATELAKFEVEVWLTDISPQALDVARANLAGLGLINGDVHLARGSWFDALEGQPKNSFDLVVSNPPYIAVNDPSVEAIVFDHEPHIALFSGTDGLDACREIISQADNWLVNSGWLVLEIGHDQGQAVKNLLEQQGFTKIEIRQDYCQRDRIALAQKN